MKPYLLLWVTLSVLPTLQFNSFAEAARETKPFWAEKSAFIEGDDLFVVGVASKARTVEGGRKQAFENGKLELMNYAQVTSLEAQGLVIETQMTYEEPNTDGSVNVFRLLRVPVSKLVAIQGRLQTQGRVQEYERLQKDHARLIAELESLKALLAKTPHGPEREAALGQLREREKASTELQTFVNSFFSRRQKVCQRISQLWGETPEHCWDVVNRVKMETKIRARNYRLELAESPGQPIYPLGVCLLALEERLQKAPPDLIGEEELAAHEAWVECAEATGSWKRPRISQGN